MPHLADPRSTLPHAQRRFPWGALFCGYCAAILLAQLVHQSALKPLWRDEQFTFFEVHGKSFGEIFQSLKSGINLLPPTYFFLLSALLRFTDFTPLLGRALSCSFIVATVPLLWLTLRRTSGTLITAIAISGVVFCSSLIFYHNSEARPYGLFFFAAGLVALAFARSLQEERPRPSTFVLLLFANAFLPSVNYAGGFYGAAALVVTLVADRAANRRRWRIYGAYLGGWAIFAVLLLPLCWVQYRTRGAEGTSWLPNFHESVIIQAKQWAKTIIPFAVLSVPFAVWLFFGQRAPTRQRPPAEAGVPSPWPIAALGLAWLLIPVVFIGQSLVTRHNMYMDRYFIASDLGLILFVAALASLATTRWRGSAVVEDSLRTPLHRSLAALLGVLFVLFVSIRFYQSGRNALWGTGDAVYACRAWPGPKATFSLSYFIEGYARSGPGMRFILLSRRPTDRATMGAYCRDFEIKEFDELAAFPEFVFVESSETPKDFSLTQWAQSHAYAVEQVGFYKEAHDTKTGIFRVKRTPLAVISPPSSARTN